jgi:hypothetical protein
LKQRLGNTDIWYIMGMFCLQRGSFRKAFALFMALAFFGSQAFSCCLVNRRMVDSFAATLTALLPTAAGAPSHSCCPSKNAPGIPHGKQDGAHSNGCCIQDANSKVPQIASEGIVAPAPSTLVLEQLAGSDAGSAKPLFARVSHHPVFSPPLYLSHRQLLI